MKSPLSEQEQIEFLATRVMRWTRTIHCNLGEWITENDDDFVKDWNPLTDWNHWRKVEERVMEDNELKWEMIKRIHHDDRQWLYFYMLADLPTRCQALIAAHQELYSSK